MEKSSFWSYVFKGKGVYNGASPLLVWFLLPPPGDRLYFHLFLALAFCFGIGYWAVGQDLRRNRSVVWMGVGGQGAVCLFSLMHNLSLPPTLERLIQIGAGLVDGSFAVLFAIFLYKTRLWKPL